MPKLVIIEEKLEILKLKYDDLNNEIPFYVKSQPAYNRGQRLQAETYKLFDDLLAVAKGDENGKN